MNSRGILTSLKMVTATLQSRIDNRPLPTPALGRNHRFPNALNFKSVFFKIVVRTRPRPKKQRSGPCNWSKTITYKLPLFALRNLFHPSNCQRKLPLHYQYIPERLLQAPQSRKGTSLSLRSIICTKTCALKASHLPMLSPANNYLISDPPHSRTPASRIITKSK